MDSELQEEKVIFAIKTQDGKYFVQVNGHGIVTDYEIVGMLAWAQSNILAQKTLNTGASDDTAS